MTKKNSTIIVLTIMLISVFALNSFAFCERYFGVYLELVDIEDLILRGAAPMTQEAILDTRSPTVYHKAFVAMGCYVCGGWKEKYSTTDDNVNDGYVLDPESVRVGKTFSSTCWTHENASEHCAAYYDAVPQN